MLKFFLATMLVALVVSSLSSGAALLMLELRFGKRNTKRKRGDN